MKINWRVPKNWQPKKIADIATLSTGSTPLRSEYERYFKNGTIPWIKTMDLNNGSILSTDEKITETALRECSCSLLPIDTVLVAMYGGFQQIGRTGLTKIEAATNQAISAITIKDNNVKPAYLLWWLNAHVSLWRRFAASSRKDPNITKNEVASFPVLVPPLPEQEDMVDILGTWHAAVEITEELIAAKHKHKKALIQRLLTGKRRFAGFNGKWRTYRLGDILKEVRRHVMWDDDQMYHLVSVRRRSGGLFFRESRHGRDIKTKALKTTRTGDFVVARMQVLHGAMAITTPQFDQMNVSNSYLTFVPKHHDLLYMPFLGWLSQTPLMYYKAFISSYGVAIEKMTFNLKWFLDEEITIPPTIEEQQRIASILATCDQEIALLQAQAEALKKQKRGLMQKLLMGQIRLKGD